MRFYVIFEKCDNGYRDTYRYVMRYETFGDLDNAIEFIKSIRGNDSYQNIIGPLFLARSLELEDDENDEV